MRMYNVFRSLNCSHSAALIGFSSEMLTLMLVVNLLLNDAHSRLKTMT